MIRRTPDSYGYRVYGYANKIIVKRERGMSPRMAGKRQRRINKSTK